EKLEELYDIPVGATTTGLPPGVFYRVRATYKYTAEDEDELDFDSGEIIQVVEYDDPDEQEEGWLMGIKESTNQKGLFPANFTRPI
ncbi:myc box-dependent-interacting protein 1-like, partial [Tachypleus tridentatus]|uniref:myc box-dependent-interacting protein 1-like n=1 Tax=Tachypleus tridentatus TaxID=6853 RepID=UPI003FD019A3